MRHTPCGYSPPKFNFGYFVGADVGIGPFVRLAPECRICGDTATVAPRAFVLTNSTFLAPPQAAGLVRSVARPLQIANASLVCNLVPSGLSEKVCKKRRWMRIGLYRKPLNKPVEKHCGQHTGVSLQSCTTAPPAWRQHSHRKQLPRKELAKHAAVECRTRLRIRRWCTIFAFYCKCL